MCNFGKSQVFSSKAKVIINAFWKFFECSGSKGDCEVKKKIFKNVDFSLWGKRVALHHRCTRIYSFVIIALFFDTFYSTAFTTNCIVLSQKIAHNYVFKDLFVFRKTSVVLTALRCGVSRQTRRPSTASELLSVFYFHGVLHKATFPVQRQQNQNNVLSL